MATLNYEIACLRCGFKIRGKREENERKVHFICPKCSGRFSITFDLPDLEAAFLNGELPPNIMPRPKPVDAGFPAGAVFNFKRRRKTEWITKNSKSS